MIVLEVVLIGIMFGLFLCQSYHTDEAGTATVAGQEGRTVNRTPEKRYTYAVETEPVETFPFDPNTADSTQLLRLGLAPWQVQAIYRYRAKHGRYHTPEDFQRVPGMTLELWERLGPMVRIDARYQYLKPSARIQDAPQHPQPLASPSSTVSADSVQPATAVTAVMTDTVRRVEKFAEPTRVDINEADTLLLQRIPGIASVRARRIVEYREKLGGFSHLEQVMESCQLPDEVLEWLSFRPVPLKKLDVNHLSVRQLMRHPYLSFYQAKALVEHRQKHGLLSGVSELKQIEGFSDEHIQRLAPYLLFDVNR